MEKYCRFGRIFLLIFFLCVPFFGSAVVTSAEKDAAESSCCKYCGMSLAKLAHSRVCMTYDDGISARVCSLHCAAIEMLISLDKEARTIMVGDYNSKKLIDAGRAYWVIGGSEKGVMTTRAKWAFKKKKDAGKFVKEYGGKLGTFDDALKATFEDMYPDDIEMIREKRKMMKTRQMRKNE